ncbi:MAG: UbiD family decarboxylase [Planctomycetota bacterium]|nr:UbiD family decarboxylase [Planctomycetota bacterium]
MPNGFPTLGDMIRFLDAEGSLIRINEEISPLLEVAAIADLHSKIPAPRASNAATMFDPARANLGGKALLFENITGSDFPLAINIFGSYARMEQALGCDPTRGFSAIADTLEALTAPRPPTGIRDALARLRTLRPLLKAGPKLKRRGPCQDIVQLTSRGEVDLHRLPIIKCWPLDGDPSAVGWNVSSDDTGTAGGEGRYITFAGIHTIHADDRGKAKPPSHNIGMYRVQLIDGTHLAMHWHLHHDGAAHWRSWKAIGEPMPVAICFGGESVLPYAATAPLPPGVSELLMAGFLNGRGIPLVKAKTVPLRVPANAEIVIEGFVRTDAGNVGWEPESGEPLGEGAVIEGPFGDHTGWYSMPDRYPILEVTALTHRRNAIYPTTIVGVPPQEDYYLGKATERIFLPLLKLLVPDIVDYHLPLFGCFHNCVFVSIRKAYALQARRLMHAIWGAGQMAWTKMIVVVDDDVNVHDETAVLNALATHCQFQRDVEIVSGPLDILDHAAPRLGAGHKIGFDATRVWPGEEVAGVPADPPVIPDVEHVRATLDRSLCKASFKHHVPAWGQGRIIVLGVNKNSDGPGSGGHAIESVLAADPSWTGCVLAVEGSVDLSDTDMVLFYLAANMDPGRDLYRDGARLGIDGTSKVDSETRHGQPVRKWPPPIRMDEEVLTKLNVMAQAFGLEPWQSHDQAAHSDGP